MAAAIREPAALTHAKPSRMRYCMETAGEALHHPTPDMARATLTALHIDDTVTTCDCCGRQNLKATVLMRDAETGAESFFGRTCAARNSGKTGQQITEEVRSERDAAHGRTMNQLADMRRAGVVLTRQIMREVAESFRADAGVILRCWGHWAA